MSNASFFSTARARISDATSRMIWLGEVEMLSTVIFPASILGDVEDVVDERQEVLGVAADRLHVIDPFARAERGVEEKVGVADDGRHRRPDLVAHVGEEGRLGPVRVEAVLPGRLELHGLTLEQLRLDQRAEEGLVDVTGLDPEEGPVRRDHDAEAHHEPGRARHEEKSRQHERPEEARDVEPQERRDRRPSTRWRPR